MDAIISIIAVCAGIFGIIGSIVPGLPGPPVSWVGMLLLYFWGGTNGNGEHMSLALLIGMCLLMIAVTIIDYYVPASFTKITGGSRFASRGAIIGLVIGLFFTPIGMLIGAFAGAYVCERYWGKKGRGASAKAAGGAFLGFLTGTGIKLIASCIMMWMIIVYL